MKPRKFALKAVKLGWIALLPLMASAAERGSTAMVSVAGGIAMPSYSTSYMQNAAGLVFTPGTNLILQGGGDSTFANQTFRGGLAYGNGSIGIGGGVTYGNPSAATGAYYGLGFGIPSARMAFGISGTTGLSPSTDSAINAGMIISPSTAFSLGFTAMGLTTGISEIGAGLAINLGSSASLVVDSAFSNSLAFLTIQPGLRVGNANASLTVSYGSGSGSTQLNNNDFSAGASLKLGSKVNWELYYNRFATYYTGFAIML